MTPVYAVVSTQKDNHKVTHIESLWFDKDKADSIVSDMDDDFYTFETEEFQILDRPKSAVG